MGLFMLPQSCKAWQGEGETEGEGVARKALGVASWNESLSWADLPYIGPLQWPPLLPTMRRRMLRRRQCCRNWAGNDSRWRGSSCVRMHAPDTRWRSVSLSHQLSAGPHTGAPLAAGLCPPLDYARGCRCLVCSGLVSPRLAASCLGSFRRVALRFCKRVWAWQTVAFNVVCCLCLWIAA